MLLPLPLLLLLLVLQVEMLLLLLVLPQQRFLQPAAAILPACHCETFCCLQQPLLLLYMLVLHQHCQDPASWLLLAAAALPLFA
jgi:hypothetical protein